MPLVFWVLVPNIVGVVSLWLVFDKELVMALVERFGMNRLVLELLVVGL